MSQICCEIEADDWPWPRTPSAAQILAQFLGRYEPRGPCDGEHKRAGTAMPMAMAPTISTIVMPNASVSATNGGRGALCTIWMQPMAARKA